MCHLALAALYLALREDSSLQESVAEGTRLAREMGDKNALFHLALIQLSHSGEVRFRREAENLIDDLDTERDKALLYLTLLERDNSLEVTDNSDEFINRMQSFFEGQSEDIDLARYHLALAHYYYLIDERERAGSFAARAADMSGKRKLLPEQWRALVFLSETSFEIRDFEASFKYARQATDCVKRVAAHIKGTDRIGRFYNDQRITALLGRIKSLQAILSKMKGATTVGSP
jgi:hypothetical protein